jgi:hypothetical protein
MTDNPYAKMMPVGIDVRADMLETVCGYSEDQFQRELDFAFGTVDDYDTESLRWLAACIARRIDELEAAGK